MRVILTPILRLCRRFGHGRAPWLAVVAALAVLATAPACKPSPAAANGRLTVLASFYPIAYAAQRVGGDLVSVTDLTPPGVEPHDLELTPHQLEDIATADVVLYMAGGFQPAVQDAVGDASGEVVDVSAGLRTLPVPAGETEPSLVADPHVWLDPQLFAKVVATIGDALRRADPAAASTFSTNARHLERDLAAMDAEYRTGLADCARKIIVTSHAAFGYLAARYGLQQEAISGLSPDAEPTPRRLAQLRSVVERDGLTTIFTEDLLSPKVADTLARETGARTEVLSPIESLTPAELAAGRDYLSVMRSNLAKLEAALGCR